MRLEDKEKDKAGGPKEMRSTLKRYFVQSQIDDRLSFAICLTWI